MHTDPKKNREGLLEVGKLPANDGASQGETTGGVPDTQVSGKRVARRRTFSNDYKLRFLEEYEACETSLARGALLRRESLYYSRVATWRKQRDCGHLTASGRQRMQKMARENAALQKKLAQAQAIIELQKKVSDILGQHILKPENNG